ncbi:hypothetical protein L2E82_51172 [Cichorium intybus]|nr:hypothetical protein L2E82_51172 [Cichorium intybus]
MLYILFLVLSRLDTMEPKEKPVQLKVYVDKKKTKVMFAEAEEDFVDILFSFFTLPLGIIARLSKSHADSKEIRVGSLTSLYESVVNLNAEHFSDKSYKDILVNPVHKSPSICQNLKVILDESWSLSKSGAVFVKNKTKFIITEDLNVVPVKLNTSIVLLNSLGVENINMLEERTIRFGFEEYVDLLMWSLLTNNPLTNLVLGGSKPCSSCVTNSILSNSAFISSNSGKNQTVTLIVQKSKKKLLCAEAEDLFVELLFSFLTIPLGSFFCLTKDDSTPLALTNLYNSISCLGERKYLRSEDVKNMLLCPKVAGYCPEVTDFLSMNGPKSYLRRFLKDPATFIVSDNLEVTASSIDTISTLNTLGVSVGDMEVLEVSIGEKEAPLLLKACLSSTSALTDFLNTLSEKTNGSI